MGASQGPARQVRDEDVFAEMELGFVQDPPSTGSAIAELERWCQAASESTRGDGVPRRRPRAHDEFARDELADDVVGAFDEETSASGACLMGGRKCNDGEPCEAHVRWLEVRAAALAPMRETTIADLLGRSAGAGARAKVRA